MPPPPKQKGRIQIKIMGLPGMPRSPQLGSAAQQQPKQQSPRGSPAFKLLSPKLTPKLAPLDGGVHDLPALDEHSDSVSEGSSADEEAREEALHETIDTFKHQMHQIYMASKAAERQIEQLAARAAAQSAELQVQPLRPRAAVSAWLAERGLCREADPSLAEFMEICLDTAESQDLETRTITFSAADAAVLTGGQRRVTVFELLRAVPKLFI